MLRLLCELLRGRRWPCLLGAPPCSLPLGLLPVPHAASTAQANAGSMAYGRLGLPHTLACGTTQCTAGEFAETRGRVRENPLNPSTKRCFTEEMCVSATCGCRPCSSPAESPVQGAGDLPWRERLQDGQVEISSGNTVVCFRDLFALVGLEEVRAFWPLL